MLEYRLDTPLATVDLDIVDRNIGRLQKMADHNGVKVRPHIKTHKSILFANAQLDAGAVGITAAKLGEAETMAEAGLKDILIAYPILGSGKLERLKKLLQTAEVILSVDNLVVAEGISRLGVSLDRKIRVYIEIDTGLRRTGRQPGQDALDFAQSVRSLPGIEIVGIMSHGGHCYGSHSHAELEKIALTEARMMTETREMMESCGIPVQEVSLGATPTARFLKGMKGVTEIRPGTYIFNDYNQLLLGAAMEEDCAIRIVTTVISRPAADRIVIDAGSKTLTSDANVLGRDYGYVLNHPDFHIERLSEEHGMLTIPPDSVIGVGEQLWIIPNHVCPVVNLADEIVGIRDGKWRQVIPIDARGKNR